MEGYVPNLLAFVSTSLSNIGGLAVGAFDHINPPCLLLGSSLTLTLVSKSHFLN